MNSRTRGEGKAVLEGEDDDQEHALLWGGFVRRWTHAAIMIALASPMKFNDDRSKRSHAD